MFWLNHHNQALTEGQKLFYWDSDSIVLQKQQKKKTSYSSIQILKLNYQHFSFDHDIWLPNFSRHWSFKLYMYNDNMRISFISYCILVMGAIMVLDCLFMFSGNNLLHEEAENPASGKNKDKKSQETVQETQIKAETVHLSLLRQLRSPDVSIIYW